MHRSAKQYRRPAICAADIRRLGGSVTISADRDRTDGAPVYQIHHTSRGGDIVRHSSTTPSAEHAEGGARFLAEFLGGSWR